MKTKIFIRTVLFILSVFFIMGCGETGSTGFDLSKLPGPPPPPPPAEITWIAQPRAGITSSLIFTFSEDPGDITANDVILSDTTVTKGALNLIVGNSHQRQLMFVTPAGIDETIKVDIPNYTNEETDQKIVAGEKTVEIFGTPSYFSVEAKGTLTAMGRENSSYLEFTFTSDPEGNEPRDIGVLYPNDITISHSDPARVIVRNRIIGNNSGDNIRSLTIQNITAGLVTINFSPGILSAGEPGSNQTELKTAPATFTAEIALNEWGEPKGNLLLHMTRRIDTANLQTSNLILTGVTTGPTGIAGAASLTSMGPINDRWGRTFGMRVTRTGDITIQWRFRPDQTAAGSDDANLGDIIDLDYVSDPITVYR